MARKLKTRKVCDAFFPHVRDSHKTAEKRGWSPTPIRYSDRKKAFCFSYKLGAHANVPAGQRGH